MADDERIAQIKDRVSLRELMERDGMELKKSGAAFVTCCPFHREKSASFVVHDKESGDWYHCFGCGASGDVIKYWTETRHVTFPAALDELSRIAGLSLGALPAPLPKREIKGAAPDVPVDPLTREQELTWERAAAELYTDTDEVAKMAAWRGYRPEVVEWAARRQLVGRLINRGEWREAFLIQRPFRNGEERWALENIGWHVRLAPGSRNNNDKEKASWRYEPRNGLGAWPFVILPEGGIEAVKYLFACEGQWDGLALVDLMGWEKVWPPKVGVFGMRGSTSWKRLLDYPLRPDLIAFLIADRDAAGKGWFQRDEKNPVTFSEALETRVKYVHGFWPAEWSGKKDLNDTVKVLDETAREMVRLEMRKKIQPQAKRDKPGPTFWVWLKRQHGRAGEIGDFARKAIAEGNAPHGRSRQTVWMRYVSKTMGDPSLKDLETAWEEWSKG